MEKQKWALYHRPDRIGGGWKHLCNSRAETGKAAINEEYTDKDNTVYWSGADGTPERPASVWGTSTACYLPFVSQEALEAAAKRLQSDVEYSVGLPGIRLRKYSTEPPIGRKFLRIDELIQQGVIDAVRTHDNAE